MPELSRAQLAVYAAIAIVALLLGARWIRAEGVGGGQEGSIAYGNQGEAPPDSGGGEEVQFDETGEDVVVHVAGAVQDPGVYRLPEGSRVTDAIERAGGVAQGGAQDAVNLAAPVADGQQIHIPGKGQSPVGTGSGTGDGPISLGSATVEELDTIEGIGPVTAAGIIEFRDQHGGVASIDELDQITGIGPATMEALRARLQP